MYRSGGVLLELGVEIERPSRDAHRLLFRRPRKGVFTGIGLPRLMTCGFDAAVALITNIIRRGKTRCR
jgi:hypothetical protein